MEEKIKPKKWMLKSLYSNQIKPSFLSKSSVENILTFDCSLKAVSSDQIAQFRDNASAKYGSSLECGANLLASSKNSLYSNFGIISIFLSNNENKNINVNSSIFEYCLIFSLSSNNSLNANFGDICLKPLPGSFLINFLLAESSLKKENNMQASITKNIHSTPCILFSNNYEETCLLDALSFSSEPNFNANSSVILLFFNNSSAILNRNASDDLSFNALDTISLNSFLSRFLVKTSSSSGISTFNSAILTSNAKEDNGVYKSFGKQVCRGCNPCYGTFEDDGSAELFLDGISVESSSDGPKLKSNLYKAWIGSWSGLTNEFNGTIDNVAIYSRALNSQTIKSHYERGIKAYSINRLRTTSTKEQWNETIRTNLRVVW